MTNKSYGDRAVEQRLVSQKEVRLWLTTEGTAEVTLR